MIREECLNKVAVLNPQELSVSAWACATMQLKDEVLMAELAREALSRLDQFGDGPIVAPWNHSPKGSPEE